jgi:hypothetical protein
MASGRNGSKADARLMATHPCSGNRACGLQRHPILRQRVADRYRRCGLVFLQRRGPSRRLPFPADWGTVAHVGASSARSYRVPLARLFEHNTDLDADWASHGLILRGADRAEKALGRLSEAIDRNALAMARLSATDVTALYQAWLAVGRVETRREDVSRSIATAETLWHEGNYGECVRLLSEIEPGLSPAQLKRREMARRKTQPS